MHDRQQTWIWIVSLVVFLRAAGGSVVLIAEMPEEPTPTHRDVPYGPHARNVLDFWQAEGVGPRPLLVYIHGGGWTGGDKKQDPRAWLPVHEMGISYAAFNYRLAPQDPLPAPVLDAARAIQYLRTRAKEWNIDTSRIALTGGSAGGCSSLWLLLHDDLADPQSSDPVLRESTRVCAATVFDAQTSIDPKVIEPWVGPNILQHRMIHLSVAEPTMQSALDNYETHRAAYAEFSPYNHVDKDDPPLQMICHRSTELPSIDKSHGIHHPLLSLKLKEKSDRVGHECHLVLVGTKRADPIPAAAVEFLTERLLRPKE